jgi:ATP-binding cassette subfamily C (CFTR/MRP) protein 1
MYWHRQSRFLVKVRGVLTTAVYRKSMEIAMSHDEKTKSITLMSTDCEKVVRGLMDIHELWANILQIGLATWLMERELGIACVTPIIVAVGMTPRLLQSLAPFNKFASCNWSNRVSFRFRNKIPTSMARKD